MENLLFDKFVKKYFLENVNENRYDEIQRMDFYPIFNEFLPGIVYCFAKKQNESEMSLFSMSDPDLINIGVYYGGNLDMSSFWSSIENALKFNYKDFYAMVKKIKVNAKKKKKDIDRELSSMTYEISKDGKISIYLRGGVWGESCLKKDVAGNIFDSMSSPDSLLGSMIHASNVNRFKRWVLNKISKDKDFVRKDIA